MSMRPWILIGPTLLLVAACAKPIGSSPFVGFYRGYENCRAQYAEMDARVDAAGVRDAEFYRVPGYPYLRTDRLLATFRHQVHGLNDVSEWMRRMRELDQDSRDFEYANLGIGELEASLLRDRFLNCGRILADIELQDPKAWERLLELVVPQDAYSGAARFVGLHALRVPGIRSRASTLHQRMAQEQVRPPNPQPPGALEWRARLTEDPAMVEQAVSSIQFNVLGFPNLYGSQWRALVETHAPHLRLASQDDGPVTPEWTADGIGADPSRPIMSYQIGYTRFGGSLLVQITYWTWFASQKASCCTPIDGLVWRVTLDRRLEPMIYESVHPSGADHRWYPARPIQFRRDDMSEESFVSPEMAPARDPVLWIETGTHRLVRVSDAGAAPSSPSIRTPSFALQPYEDLYTLPLPDGGTRSLFGPDGLISESQGHDTMAGWSSGITRPGALRQAGHHAIGYITRRHFDDPDLMEATFVVPPSWQEGSGPSSSEADRPS